MQKLWPLDSGLYRTDKLPRLWNRRQEFFTLWDEIHTYPTHTIKTIELPMTENSVMKQLILDDIIESAEGEDWEDWG